MSEQDEALGLQPGEKLLTVNDAAQILAISPWTVRKWLTESKLVRCKVGRATRVRLRDLNNVLEVQPVAKEG